MNEQYPLGKLKVPGLELSVSVVSHCLIVIKVNAKFRGDNYDHSTVLYCNTCPVCGKHIFNSNKEHIHHIGKHPLMKEPLTEASPVAFRVYLVGEKSICVCVDCLKDDDQVDTYSLQVQLNHCPMC